MSYKAPTWGTRLGVWAFPALTLWLGWGYAFTDRIHYQGVAFNGAEDVMSLREWGIIFLVVGLVELVALVMDEETAFIMAMCAGIGLYSVWSALFAYAYYIDAHTSPGAPAWPLFVVVLHFAILETITNGAFTKFLRGAFRRGD